MRLKPSGATQYTDFVIQAHRTNPQSIEVGVSASPVGATAKRVPVEFSFSEARGFREMFRTGGLGMESGGMLITQEQATKIGKRMAEILFPGSVFRLLAQSLAQIARYPEKALRIRLALDSSLIDLPWEYVYRPDRLENEGLSGFLLLDCKISLVREDANSRIIIQPISGKQRLSVVGTFWEGGIDNWEVEREYTQLRAALKPVSSYISPEFVSASDLKAFSPSRAKDLAIFHYAGHFDFELDGQAYLIRENPTSRQLPQEHKLYVDELAFALSKSGTRLVALSACNSGFWPVVAPLIRASIPAVIGINGSVGSGSTIEFFSKLYESLAIGLSLDEAVDRARLHVLEWGQSQALFDWGLFMIYMPSPSAVLFPRSATTEVTVKQTGVRQEHEVVIDHSIQLARNLDGRNFGEILSELTRRRVLILGRFTGRRLKILKAIQARLAEHPNRYIAELFTFARPESRDLIESIIGFASLSRFIVADLSEPKSVQSELEAIVKNFLSVPVVPLISRTGKEYATFASIQRRENVAKPTVRYRDLDDLLEKLDDEVVPKAEALLEKMRPDGDDS